MTNSKQIKHCQICKNKNLKSILFLGYLPPVNQFNNLDYEAKEQPSYPAELLLCEKCKLVQLSTVVDQRILFPPEYPYTSSTTKILRENFYNLSKDVKKNFNYNSDDLIIDIGSNDGNLLSNFKSDFRVLGITPEKIGKIAIKRGIDTLIKYFNLKTANLVVKKYGKAKIITATNVFAHIDNLENIMKGIKKCLDKDGIFITESHYLIPLLKDIQYDTVYHEHLRYYSLTSLNFLFKKFGLEIFDAKEIPTHGGSIRVYCANNNKFHVSKKIQKILNKEKKFLTKKFMNSFQEKVSMSKLKLLEILAKIKKKNKNTKISGISAPSRSATLINYVGLDEKIIDCIFEIKGSYKINRFMPGTKIPVKEEKASLLRKTDYLVLFSWHISKELIKNIRKQGFKGKFIIPLPKPIII
ncbi:class I SAM-dependent methyltransferase [Candidatus Pelagibacter sp.]|nr:class I SAM-dependent methyltransferase [Candidatus Pelagibacter sp.]